VPNENRRLKRMYADLSMQADLLNEALGKKEQGHPLPGRQMPLFAVGRCREMTKTAVERQGASIALACRAFGISETCYRYSPKLKDENEEIADLLTGLTDARKTRGVRPMFSASAQRGGASMDIVTRQCIFTCMRGHKRVYRIYCQLELTCLSSPAND
jgi:hypothetical protein